MENFWQACSAQLEQELTPQQFSAWIKPLTLVDYEEGKLRIGAPNRFKLDWVKTQFANRITELASQFWSDPIDVQFILDPYQMNVKLPTSPNKPANEAPTSANEDSGRSSGERHSAAVESPELDQNRQSRQSRINHALTFDSLVTGKANQLVYQGVKSCIQT